MELIDSDDFYTDTAYMYGIDPDRTSTALPRACCLKELANKFKNHQAADLGQKFAKVRITEYQFGATKDVGSITIETPASHPMRKDGLAFVQLYATHKNLYDAQGQFPYPHDDDSGICLALDHLTLEGLSSIVHRPTPVINTSRESWRASGYRLTYANLVEHSQDFPIRLEARMSRTLRLKIIDELRARRAGHERQVTSEPGNVYRSRPGCPFYLHETRDVCRFIHVNVITHGRLFQEIIGRSSQGTLESNHQKLAAIVNMLQKFTYSSTNLRQYPRLWKSMQRTNDQDEDETNQVSDDDEPPSEKRFKETFGLGLKTTIEKYGYGYMDPDVIDWGELRFTSTRVASLCPRASDALSGYKARRWERKRVKDFMEEINDLLWSIKRERNSPEVRTLLLHALAFRLIKRFLQDVCEQLLSSDRFEFPRKDHILQHGVDGSEKSEADDASQSSSDPELSDGSDMGGHADGQDVTMSNADLEDHSDSDDYTYEESMSRDESDGFENGSESLDELLEGGTSRSRDPNNGSSHEQSGSEVQRRLDITSIRQDEPTSAAVDRVNRTKWKFMTRARKKRALKRRGPNPRKANIAAQVKDPPGLTFQELSAFLGEAPTSLNRALKWDSYGKVWESLWSLEPSIITKRGKRMKKLYLRAYELAAGSLGPFEDERKPGSPRAILSSKLRRYFEYYCPCVQAISLNEFIRVSPRRKRPAFMAFRMDDGSQHWHPIAESGRIDPDCSWDLTRRPIQWDALWDFPVAKLCEDTPERRQLLQVHGTESYLQYDSATGELAILDFYESATQQTRDEFYRDERHRKDEQREVDPSSTMSEEVQTVDEP